jgi:hypothetical protein
MQGERAATVSSKIKKSVKGKFSHGNSFSLATSYLKKRVKRHERRTVKTTLKSFVNEINKIGAIS